MKAGMIIKCVVVGGIILKKKKKYKWIKSREKEILYDVNTYRRVLRPGTHFFFFFIL